MTFTEDVKNRLTAMLDYTMARAAEFKTEISMTATTLGDGSIFFSARIGTADDGASAQQTTDVPRWYSTYKNGIATEVK